MPDYVHRVHAKVHPEEEEHSHGKDPLSQLYPAVYKIQYHKDRHYDAAVYIRQSRSEVSRKAPAVELREISPGRKEQEESYGEIVLFTGQRKHSRYKGDTGKARSEERIKRKADKYLYLSCDLPSLAQKEVQCIQHQKDTDHVSRIVIVDDGISQYKDIADIEPLPSLKDLPHPQQDERKEDDVHIILEELIVYDDIG